MSSTEVLEKTDNFLLNKLEHISHLIGNTPIISFTGKSKGIIAKLEYSNFSGSTKDRATLSILKNAIENNLLKQGSTIIESTSGNFGISLAHFSIVLNLNFTPVIDPNITSTNKNILEFMCDNVIEVTERDITGGYLLNRLKKIEELKEKNPEIFHPNQYGNQYNCHGYKLLATEIANQVDHLDYIVVAVSTGGTITGISSEIKKYFPDIKVVAVDVKGSMVFEKTPKKRSLSGLGSSKKSNFILKNNSIDEVIIFEEEEIIESCRKMAKNQAIFAGASSGATFAGAQKILKKHQKRGEEVKIMIICPDRGTSYVNSFKSKQ